MDELEQKIQELEEQKNYYKQIRTKIEQSRKPQNTKDLKKTPKSHERKANPGSGCRKKVPWNSYTRKEIST